MARLFYLHLERRNMQDVTKEGKELDEQFETTGRNHQSISIERQVFNNPNTHPVNGNYNLPDEDEDDDDTEDDLVLGDEDEPSGDEEEFDVELDDELDEEDIDEDDLVIEADDDGEDDD